MNELPSIPGMDWNPPAPEDAIAALEQRLGQTLPTNYKQFLQLANGASLSGGLLLFSTDLIEERNKTWEVQLYAPGFLAICGTGAGEAILILRNGIDSRLFIVGTGSMTPDMMRELSPSIEQWLNNGCELPDD